MEMSGVVELIEKVNAKGNTFFSVRVAGQYVGNAYESIVKDFKTGDHVKVIYETKNNFKNVINIEKSDGIVNTEVSNNNVISGTTREIPYPKGYEPHPVSVNKDAFYLAQLFVNTQNVDKTITKKSALKQLSIVFELAKPIKDFLTNGVTPDGTEQLSDED